MDLTTVNVLKYPRTLQKFLIYGSGTAIHEKENQGGQKPSHKKVISMSKDKEKNKMILI